MKKSFLKATINAFILGAAIFGITSCSNDKTEPIKEAIAAAYAAAADSINNAPDEATAARISEQLQATIAGISAKYKDVTEILTEEEQQSIASFCKEQKDLLYKNASESGKKLIDAVSSTAENAFGATVTSVVDTVVNVKNAAQDAVENAKDAVEQTKQNAKDAVDNTVNSAKEAASATVDNAKSAVKESANQAVTNAQTKANEATNKAAAKASEEINKGLNKVLGK